MIEINLSRDGLDAASDAFATYGIDFRTPRHSDLDDLEIERYEAMCAAIRAYLAATGRDSDGE